MAKPKDEDLQRLKRIQDVDDDDLSLDVTKSRKMLVHSAQKAKEQKAKEKDAEEQKSKENKTEKQNTSKESQESRQDSGKGGQASGAGASTGSSKGEKPEENPAEQKKDRDTLLVMLGILAFIVVIFALLILLRPGKERPVTIDDLHQANLQGELDPEDGYVYNGYSFIKFDNLWYSQLAKNNTIYDVTFNNGPRDVEDIPVEGQLSGAFSQGETVYITFDPTGNYLNYVGVANYGLSRSLAWAFGYDMKAGCTKNVTKACEKAGLVVCGDADHPERTVIFFKEHNETKVVLDMNCITIQGAGPDIVRAKDRLLMRWYGMMD